MQSFPLLSAMAFFPLLGIPVILLLPQSKASYAKWLGLVFTLPSLALGVVLYGSYNRELAGVFDPASFQFIERVPWIKTFNIEYFVGIDGLSVMMVLLTVLLCTLCMVASFSIKQSPKGYFSLFLLLETGMLGVFISLDFVLFYVFWEVMLLPMYFLIGVWGGQGVSTLQSNSFCTLSLAACLCLLPCWPSIPKPNPTPLISLGLSSLTFQV